MNRDYWDRQADRWEAEIFDSLSEDRTGGIRGALRRAAARHAEVLDFGCGVGGYLPFLARTFKRVHAVDWSARCVARARERTAALANVTLERNTPRALARLEHRFGCVIAANVVIHPRRAVRERLLRSIGRVARQHATTLFVVPSLESAAYCEYMRRETAPRQRSSYDFTPEMRAPEAGVVSIEGVPTKHFTGDELTATLSRSGFRLVELLRVNYAWKTERLSPPRGLRSVLPWDWLAVTLAN